jgi:hypothetical protein
VPATEPRPEPAPSNPTGGARTDAEHHAPPFALSPRRAFVPAAIAALAAGVVVAVGVARIEPSLVLHLRPTATTQTTQVFELRAEPRGGETIPTVRIEVLEGHVEIYGRQTYFDLAPDNAAMFTLRIARDAPSDPLVRVFQGGPVSRSYDMRLPVDR